MKRKITISVFFLILTMTLSVAVAAAEGHGYKQPMKKGILLVAFGSSIPEAQFFLKTLELLLNKQ